MMSIFGPRQGALGQLQERWCWRLSGMLLVVLPLAGCMLGVREAGPAAVVAVASRGAFEAPHAPAWAPLGPSGTSASIAASKPRSFDDSRSGAVREPGVTLADLDPRNDLEVAPPTAVEHCLQKLEAANIRFQRMLLPLTRKQGDDFLCGAPQVVVYEGSSAGISYDERPVVTCRMAFALARFEALAQELASKYFGTQVATIRQLGTYSCRRARGGTVISEHSYANAIDIATLKLKDRRIVSVGRHFLSPRVIPRSRESRFLRELARRAYEENVFSSVLTPYFDNRHLDHFHLDLARYRIDGAHD